MGGLSEGQPVGAFDESSSVAQWAAALEAEALFPEEEEEEEVATVAADTGTPLPPPPPEEELRPPSDAYPTS